MTTYANHVIAQVVLPRLNGVPEDAVTNTWHFRRPIPGTYSTAVGQIQTALAAFYTDPPAGFSHAVGEFIEFIDRTSNACLINCYDGGLAPGARTPTTSTFTLPTAPGGSAIWPSEISCCLSFRGEDIGTANAGRRRGRVYIGPLNNAGLGATTGGEARPSDSGSYNLMGTLTEAGFVMATALDADDIQHIVWSEAAGGGAGSATDVRWYWADNAFDTQRRRGEKATSRVQVAFP